MFGNKQARIMALEEDLVAIREARDNNYKAFEDMTTDRDSMSDELDKALESCTGYESQVIQLTDDLVRERSINQALADENRDLVRQLELLKAFFSQLRIQIKLPGKK